MTPDQRQSIRITSEGNALQHVSHHSIEDSAEICRAVIDGWVNGLIRMEGPEKSFEFIAALYDRTGAGIRGTTHVHQAFPRPAPIPIVEAVPVPALPPITSRTSRSLAYLGGKWWFYWALGFIAGAYVMAWR